MNNVASPVVSVIIISYNSANFILETLNSVFSQTYENIELIISDDGSQDATIEICNDWLIKKGERFTNTKVLTVTKNSGIPANCNRGVNASNGEWIKTIAADDLLLHDCIEKNLCYVKKNPYSKIILSDMLSFIHNSNIEKEMLLTGFVCCDAKKQFESLLKEYWGNSPTYFINREIFENFQYDEEIYLMEDYPFALTVTKQGYAISYLPDITIKYRLHDKSVTSKNSEKIHPTFFYFLEVFNKKYRYPHLSKSQIRIEKKNYFRKKIIDKLRLNKKNKLFILIDKILYKIINVV